MLRFATLTLVFGTSSMLLPAAPAPAATTIDITQAAPQPGGIAQSDQQPPKRQRRALQPAPLQPPAKQDPLTRDPVPAPPMEGPGDAVAPPVPQATCSVDAAWAQGRSLQPRSAARAHAAEHPEATTRVAGSAARRTIATRPARRPRQARRPSRRRSGGIATRAIVRNRIMIHRLSDRLRDGRRFQDGPGDRGAQRRFGPAGPGQRDERFRQQRFDQRFGPGAGPRRGPDAGQGQGPTPRRRPAPGASAPEMEHPALQPPQSPQPQQPRLQRAPTRADLNAAPT